MSIVNSLKNACKNNKVHLNKIEALYADFITPQKGKQIKKLKELLDDEEFIISLYIKYAYNWVNPCLRNGLEIQDSFVKLYSKYLDDALEKIESYSGIVYRMDTPNADIEHELNWFEQKKNSSIHLKHYLSTSKEKWEDNANRIIWKIITLEKNSQGKNISGVNNTEGEVLFKRESNFQIVDVNKESYLVYLKEIPSTQENSISLTRNYSNFKFPKVIDL